MSEPATTPPRARPARRFVVCCDGTWNRSDAKNITNIEKIARTIQTDPTLSGGVQQMVEYVAGVGVGYRMDRLLGGWLGEGVFANVRAGYRYLALNYQPGDEIFLFGFSRGAYTARSMAGMIATTGLLTRESLVLGYLGEALQRYKNRPAAPATSEFSSPEEFRAACCHAENPIAFVGVFDTVGALGVPTVLHTDHQFHDIRLGSAVRVARQALAIDEQRRTFAPCLWSVPDDAPRTVEVVGADGRPRTVPRVKQVWFQGVHSDVGGGYAESGLSDTTLRWMTEQAAQCGLGFDEALLDRFLDSGQPAVPHRSMKAMYVVANAIETVRPRPDVMRGTFAHGRRSLTPTPTPGASGPTTIPVRLASTARATYLRAVRPARPNLERYLSTHTPAVPDTDEEVVVGLPQPITPRTNQTTNEPTNPPTRAATPEAAQT